MSLVWILQAAAAPLLTVPVGDAPVRFGARLEAAAVRDGLSLAGRGALQWRRLPVPEADGHVWVELAIAAPPGKARVMRGGVGPAEQRRGAVYVYERDERRHEHGVEAHEVWRFCDGSEDERWRTVVAAPWHDGGEDYCPGEARTVERGRLATRAVPWCLAGEPWARDAGLLPPSGGIGRVARAARRQLLDAVAALRELPGARGAGDFGRSGGVVTNLEYDTGFVLLRCAVAGGGERALALAGRAARHLVDRDLDGNSGLPFVHGADHRLQAPETGHAWLRGLLWTGLVTADDDWIGVARQLGRAVASRPPIGVGPAERLREHACPLFELESLLAVAPEPGLARAADRLAESIALRFDPTMRTFRFGEGEVGGQVYFERAWLTAGLLLPALQLHLARRPMPALQRVCDDARAALCERVGGGGAGLPTHQRLFGAAVVAEHREVSTVQAAWLLDGIAPTARTGLLRRSGVLRALDVTLDPDDPDLPTTFTLLGRCEWPWR